MRKYIGPSILALCLATAGMAAKNPDNQNNTHNDAFAPGAENESQMAKQIRHNLLTLPYYSIFDDLAFHIDGSVVTLDGACPPEPPWDIKKDAENAVKRVAGVTQVINNIKVLPLSPMDWQIRRAVAQAIYGSSEIGTRYGFQALPSIHIIVENGHVTLEGVVDNQFDDTLIRTRANTVPYVFSVTDKLVVLNPGKKKS
ncbi:MAG TPA: BON domain-containing protein [Bryobacteraceae bacterium]|nr:BON domain-containing protein [Bryobacteraceae bacterium]